MQMIGLSSRPMELQRKMFKTFFSKGSGQEYRESRGNRAGDGIRAAGTERDRLGTLPAEGFIWVMGLYCLASEEFNYKAQTNHRNIVLEIAGFNFIFGPFLHENILFLLVFVYLWTIFWSCRYFRPSRICLVYRAINFSLFISGPVWFSSK